jgi:hypothetical protein
MDRGGVGVIAGQAAPQRKRHIALISQEAAHPGFSISDEAELRSRGGYSRQNGTSTADKTQLFCKTERPPQTKPSSFSGSGASSPLRV